MINANFKTTSNFAMEKKNTIWKKERDKKKQNNTESLWHEGLTYRAHI